MSADAAADTGVGGLAERIRHGDRGALARAISLVERGERPGEELLDELRARPVAHARPVAVTGSPGAGKSTLVSRLVTALADRGSTVRVLLIDPSSSVSGGALLGDRIRF